ncbi:MAG: WD40/YVTN/BNR-like repeat-containing protein, partial [Planctomycetota bacterium]
MFPLPESWRRFVLPVRVGLPAALLIVLVGCSASEEAGHKGKISGAYLALSHWGDSRAYPGDDIPAAAYMLAYDYSKAQLRPPQQETGGGAGSALAPGPGWEPIGPVNGGGRTLALAFHPWNPDTVFAGAASGGLWRSTTGGVGPTAWERIDTGLPVLGVSTIAFAPDDPDVMYIGTGEVYNVEASGDLEADRRTRGSYGVGVLKSVDGGVTWVKSLDWSYDQRHGVWAVRVDPLDSDIVWAATTDGVYKSIDAGVNWTQKLSVVMATDLVVHTQTPDTVLVGCGDLGSADRGIYRTINGGDTWTPIVGGGIPTDFMGKIQFGVTAADPDVVYASIGNGFNPPPDTGDNFTWLLRSDDFGASFSLRNTTDYSRWQGWYSHDVAVHPLDPDTVICVGIDIWKSTDGGSTLWQKSNYTLYYTGDLPPGGPEGAPQYSHADHHDAVWHPTDPRVFYVGNDGGVFRSLDLGETYEGVNGGYQSQQFYNGSYCSATDPDLAMGGLQDNASAIYRGGNHWTRWVLGGDGGWCAIDPTDPDIVYATAQFLYVGVSTDGGVNFSLVSPPDLGGPVAFIAPFVMSPTNPLVLYAGSNYFFKSFDGGDEWYIGQGGVEIDGNPILLLAVAPQNDDVVYLATSPYAGRGRVHRTLDGGSNFTDLTDTLPDRYPGDMTVDPTDEATVYLTMSGF